MAFVTVLPLVTLAPCFTHSQTLARQVSAVAPFPLRLQMGMQPDPRCQKSSDRNP
jgi:hypothetical protein